MCRNEAEKTIFEGRIGNVFLAKHDPDIYPNCGLYHFDLCQWGNCYTCGIELISYAKNALCPKCGSKVYLT